MRLKSKRGEKRLSLCSSGTGSREPRVRDRERAANIRNLSRWKSELTQNNHPSIQSWWKGMEWHIDIWYVVCKGICRNGGCTRESQPCIVVLPLCHGVRATDDATLSTLYPARHVQRVVPNSRFWSRSMVEPRAPITWRGYRASVHRVPPKTYLTARFSRKSL